MSARKNDPDVPSGLTDADPANMTDEQLADATTQAARDAGNLVRLRLVKSWPHDAFDPSIKGVAPVTTSGTDVPAEHSEAVIQAAKSAGLTVEKVSE